MQSQHAGSGNLVQGPGGVMGPGNQPPPGNNIGVNQEETNTNNRAGRKIMNPVRKTLEAHY